MKAAMIGSFLDLTVTVSLLVLAACWTAARAAGFNKRPTPVGSRVTTFLAGSGALTEAGTALGAADGVGTGAGTDTTDFFGSGFSATTVSDFSVVALRVLSPYLTIIVSADS
ncbi:hypothetical protein WICPIJ_008551 [Wickerhamomyces pijperi]|uniref:Secreted protein n=1 Tax=Wickerhamomyces pijperi TaxID=599730 RepID=A0A9P8PWH5_WICPI|nr:hypothetical protein WICPIJ_008551 [Wickerhamomyces pijperi]